jgi:uncharacterized protein YjdB
MLGSTACDGSPSVPSVSIGPTATATLANVNGIVILPATNTLRLGQREQFTVAVDLAPGIPPSGPLPLWSSSSPSVVAVSSNGIVTAVALGEATVQVIFRGHTASRQLQIVP